MSGEKSQSKIGPNEGRSSEGRSGSGIYGVLLPPDLEVLKEARRLSGERNSRVHDLAHCILRDPVVTMELLKVSNEMSYTATRQQIVAVKPAIIRVGWEALNQTLEELETRPQIEDPNVSKWFETVRERSRRCSAVSQFLAEIFAKSFVEDCGVCGVLLYAGELLAIINLGSRYVELAEEHPRGAIQYRLLQDYKVNLEKQRTAYLQRQGIPSAMIATIDPEGTIKTADRTIMKPILMAAEELVEAYDSNRWDKVAPGKQLPPKSAVRLLPFNDSQYIKFFERATSFLHGSTVELERKHLASLQQSEPTPLSPSEEWSEEEEEREFLESPETHGSDASTLFVDENLEEELNSLLGGKRVSEDEETTSLDSSEDDFAPTKPSALFASRTPPASPEIKGSVSIASLKRTPTIPGFRKDTRDAPSNRSATSMTMMRPPSASSRDRDGQKDPNDSQAVVEEVSKLVEKAASCQELLIGVLDGLVDKGPFEKTALLIISQDRSKATAVAIRGRETKNAETIILDNSFAPLTESFTFGRTNNQKSPFGSSAFALATIDSLDASPLALYADCGEHSVIPFEARRIFRSIVEKLKDKLGHVPGEIPREIP